VLPDERAAAEDELRRLIATLWQTRMLRPVKLGVRDEIENALAYSSTPSSMRSRACTRMSRTPSRAWTATRMPRSSCPPSWRSAAGGRRSRRQPLRDRGDARAGLPAPERDGFRPLLRGSAPARGRAAPFGPALAHHAGARAPRRALARPLPATRGRALSPRASPGSTRDWRPPPRPSGCSASTAPPSAPPRRMPTRRRLRPTST
jgi:hypothetical protein